MWSENLQSTPANAMGVPTAAGPYLPWYYNQRAQLPLWNRNQLNYDSSYEYARQLAGSFQQQSQLMQASGLNENVTPEKPEDDDGAPKDEEGGNFQDLLRNIRSLSPSASGSDEECKFFLNEAIVDIEDEEEQEEQEPCTSTSLASRIVETTKSPEFISISSSTSPVLSAPSPLLSSPVSCPAPPPLPLSPPPPPPPLPPPSPQATHRPVCCFVSRCTAKQFESKAISQLELTNHTKQSCMMSLIASLVKRPLPEPKSSALTAFQERVRSWKEMVKVQNQASHNCGAKLTTASAHGLPADSSKEMTLLRELGSIFPELRIADEEVSNSLRRDTRNRRLLTNAEEAEEKERVLTSMRNAAAIPPLMSDDVVQRIHYYRVENPTEAWRVDDNSRFWSETERAEFQDKYREHEKVFGAIASFFPYKSPGHCANYYNLKKHAEDFKKLKTRKKGVYMHNRPASLPFGTPSLSGVTLKSSSLIMLPRPHEAYLTCCKCLKRIASNDVGILTRSSRNFMDPLGDAPRRSSRQNGGHLCSACRKQYLRKQYTERICPVYRCKARPRRCREHKCLPESFFKLDFALQEALLAEYRLSPVAFKCCFACFNKISKKVRNFLHFYNDEIENDERCSSSAANWSEEEQSTLRNVLFAGCCSSWEEVAARIPDKSADMCRRYAMDNKSVIFDFTLVTIVADQPDGDVVEEANYADSIDGPSDNVSPAKSPNDQSDCQSTQSKYACILAALNGDKGDAVNANDTPNESLCGRQASLPNKRSAEGGCWKIKFAFHSSDPAARQHREGAFKSSETSKQRSDSRKSTDLSSTFTTPRDAGGSSEHTYTDHQRTARSTTPSDVELSLFNLRAISDRCSSISSDASSEIHRGNLSNSLYSSNFGGLFGNQSTTPFIPLPLMPSTLLNNWYSDGLSIGGAFSERSMNATGANIVPTAERVYSNLYSPSTDGSGTQYSISTQRQESGTSVGGLLGTASSVEQRKRLFQSTPTEELRTKVVCNGVSNYDSSIPTEPISPACSATGQTSLNAPFVSAFQSLDGLAYNRPSLAYQYPVFGNQQPDRSPSGLMNPFSLNGYDPTSLYAAAGSSYAQALQNSLLRSPGVPFFGYGLLPYGYSGIDAISERRIPSTSEVGMPTGSAEPRRDISSAAGPSQEDKIFVIRTSTLFKQLLFGRDAFEVSQHFFDKRNDAKSCAQASCCKFHTQATNRMPTREEELLGKW
uniref:Myb-like domain-containing protein n=1 Tax=Trichuris muris TaxID=70415 RepID=A0A5S6QK06_TRIMR